MPARLVFESGVAPYPWHFGDMLPATDVVACICRLQVDAGLVEPAAAVR